MEFTICVGKVISQIERSIFVFTSLCFVISKKKIKNQKEKQKQKPKSLDINLSFSLPRASRIAGPESHYLHFNSSLR